MKGNLFSLGLVLVLASFSLVLINLSLGNRL